MIKLKSLIKESKLQKLDLSKSQSGIAFTTSKDMIKFNDPYEYKFVDGIWYTRKREGYGGDNTWVDMAKNLSTDDATKAVDILLNKVYRVKTSDLKKSKPTNDNNSQETPIKQDPGSERNNLAKQDLGIKRDALGYITSGKSSVYGKMFTLRSNLKTNSIVILDEIEIEDINRATGEINHDTLDVEGILYPQETGYFKIGGIKTITMPAERGAYSKDEDPNSGRKFTYLYIVPIKGNGYKGWIPSNVVKINS